MANMNNPANMDNTNIDNPTNTTKNIADNTVNNKVNPIVKHVREGRAFFKSFDFGVIPSKSMNVFYNPEMRLNRGLTVAFVSALLNNARIALPLAATGVRGLRLLLESPKSIRELFFNDKNPKAFNLIIENIKLNKLQDLISNKVKVFNLDASVFLLKHKPFDYVDIDPFGSPNMFLDAAVKASRKFIAVTATDTAVLAGSYPKKCLRAYWALPLRNHLKHESGVRILIRKCQLIGAQYNKALIPVISYWWKHYYRVFFRVEKNKSMVNELLKQHSFVDERLKPKTRYNNASNSNKKPNEKNLNNILELSKNKNSQKELFGALWIGSLNDKNVLKQVLNKAVDLVLLEEQELLKMLIEESSIQELGFIDLHILAKRYKIKRLPRIKSVINSLIDNGFKACRTIYSPTGIRTTASEQDVLKLFKAIKSLNYG